MPISQPGGGGGTSSNSVLVIEDGTGVDGANSYATAEEARAYAALRGVVLPDASADAQDPVETWLILAADYLEDQEYIGILADPQQSLKWPRVFTSPYLNYSFYPCILGSNPWPIDSSCWQLPAKIAMAQCQLVIEQSNGITLQPTTEGGANGKFITRERTDVLETYFSEHLGTLSTPTMLKVNSLLRGLVIVGGGQTSLRTVRM